MIRHPLGQAACRGIYGLLGLAGLLALAACGLPEATSEGAGPPSVLISKESGAFVYDLNVGTGSHDVYFVFTNSDLKTDSSSSPSVAGLSVDGQALPSLSAQPAGGPSPDSTSLASRLARDNRDIRSSKAFSSSASREASLGTSPEPRATDVAGSAGSLYVLGANDSDSLAASTCRYAGPWIDTVQGQRKLNIWVADDCWGTSEGATATKRHAVTQAMVDALALRFLASGGGNDIYDWDTAVLGPEWGTEAGQYSDLIPYDKEITILLADISEDNSDSGGIVGYFWSGNNFRKANVAASNGRIMFVVDAVMYANPSDNGQVGQGGSGWTASSYWSEEVFSTLAHEFEHMIQFYAKGIVARGDGQTSETWIDEMCAQLMEDLVAEKMGIKGPRGVVSGGAGSAGNREGRIPDFNRYLSLGLSQVEGYTLEDYSFSYAFGAWLLRNYGGAHFLNRVVNSFAIDAGCITDSARVASARDQTMADLLSRWAVAVLGSESYDMPPGYRYNVGGWLTSTMNGIDYKVGLDRFFQLFAVPRRPQRLGGRLEKGLPQGLQRLLQGGHWALWNEELVPLRAEGYRFLRLRDALEKAR